MINRRFKKIFTEDVFQKVIEDVIKTDLKKDWLPEHQEGIPISRKQWKKFLKKIDLYYATLKIKIFSKALFRNIPKPNEVSNFSKNIRESVNILKAFHIKEAKKFKRNHNLHARLDSFVDIFGGTGLVLLGSLFLSTTITSIVLDIVIIASH